MFQVEAGGRWRPLTRRCGSLVIPPRRQHNPQLSVRPLHTACQGPLVRHTAPALFRINLPCPTPFGHHKDEPVKLSRQHPSSLTGRRHRPSIRGAGQHMRLEHLVTPGAFSALTRRCDGMALEQEGTPPVSGESETREPGLDCSFPFRSVGRSQPLMEAILRADRSASPRLIVTRLGNSVRMTGSYQRLTFTPHYETLRMSGLKRRPSRIQVEEPLRHQPRVSLACPSTSCRRRA